MLLLICSFVTERKSGLKEIAACCRYHAVGNLGGNSVKWLLCWETWIGMHMAAAWQLPQLHSKLAQGPSASLKRGLWQICISLVFPLAMAIVPFPGGVLYFRGLIASML